MLWMEYSALTLWWYNSAFSVFCLSGKKLGYNMLQPVQLVNGRAMLSQYMCIHIMIYELNEVNFLNSLEFYDVPGIELLNSSSNGIGFLENSKVRYEILLKGLNNK